MGAIILKLKLLDKIASSAGLTVNGMKGGKSILGANLTILIYIGVLIYGVISLQEIITYKNPIISYIEKNMDKGIDFHLSEDYPIALYLPLYKDGDPLLEIHTNYSRGNETHLPYFKECTEKDVQELSKSGTLPELENYKLYCLDRSDLPDLEISGTDSSKTVNHLSIGLWPRKKLVKEWEDDSLIYNFFDFLDFTMNIKMSSLYLYLLSNTVDPEDLDQPIKSFVKVYKFDMNFGQDTKTQIFLKKYIFETDEQLIISNIKSQSVTSIEEDEIKEINVYTNTDFYKELGNIVIKSGRKLVKYSRNYKKIDDVISNISAIFRIVIAIFQFLISPYSNYKINKYLLDKFINFTGEGINKNLIKINQINNFNFRNNTTIETPQNDRFINKSEKNLSIKGIRKRKKMNNEYRLTSFESKIDLKTTKENSNIEEILKKNSKLSNKLMKSKSIKLTSKEYKILYLNSTIKNNNKNEINKNKLKLNCFEKLILFIDLFDIKCYKNYKNFKLYLKGSEYIKSFFEISNIINGLNDIEKFKKLFLTPEQLSLFYIGIDNNMNISIDGTLETNKRNESALNIYKCEKYLKELKEGKYKTIIDKKLYDMLTNDIKL